MAHAIHSLFSISRKYVVRAVQPIFSISRKYGVYAVFPIFFVSRKYVVYATQLWFFSWVEIGFLQCTPHETRIKKLLCATVCKKACHALQLWFIRMCTGKNLNLKSLCAIACKQACPPQSVTLSAIQKRYSLSGFSTKTRRIPHPERCGRTALCVEFCAFWWNTQSRKSIFGSPMTCFLPG